MDIYEFLNHPACKKGRIIDYKNSKNPYHIGCIGRKRGRSKVTMLYSTTRIVQNIQYLIQYSIRMNRKRIHNDDHEPDCVTKLAIRSMKN